jgi:hypothetical protein
MFDGIFPDEVPAGADLYAGYDDGEWDDAAELATRFHGKIVVRVTVAAGDNAGNVLDVENGDASPSQAVGWVQRRRASGAVPTVYCSVSSWPAVRSAFQTQRVAEPYYWVADYSLGEEPPIPAGAIALQYTDTGGYDISVVADYWPGVDPAPPVSPPTPTFQEGTMYLISVTPDPTAPAGKTSTGAGIFTVDAGIVVHVDEGSLAGLEAAGGPPRVVTPAHYERLLAAQPGAAAVDVAALAAALAPLLPAAPTAAAITTAVLEGQAAAEAHG